MTNFGLILPRLAPGETARVHGGNPAAEVLFRGAVGRGGQPQPEEHEARGPASPCLTSPHPRHVFFHTVHGIILVHDLANRKSCLNLGRWLAEVGEVFSDQSPASTPGDQGRVGVGEAGGGILGGGEHLRD